LGGDKEHSKEKDKLPSTRTRRDLTHKKPYTRVSRYSVNPKSYAVKAKPKSTMKSREPTGKELVQKIMREIWSNIKRKERKERK
jgi:hypothetical protein